MAKSKKPAGNDTESNNQAPRFHVTGQYVKDLSFENPGAPSNLIGMDEKPKIEVNIDLGAQKLRDELYEVTLHINAKANSGDKPMFMVDLAYGGIFTLVNIPQERLEQILMVDCPFVLFPYARRIVSDVTRDGGFPPLMLEPIDFFTMYRKKVEANQAEAESKKTVKQ